MITVNAARAIGLKDFGIRVGSPAHMVVLKENSVLEALRSHAAPLYVISHGKLVDLASIEAMVQVKEA